MFGMQVGTHGVLPELIIKLVTLQLMCSYHTYIGASEIRSVLLLSTIMEHEETKFSNHAKALSPLHPTVRSYRYCKRYAMSFAKAEAKYQQRNVKNYNFATGHQM